MQPENRCPDRTQLLALHRGELDAKSVDMICRHLEGCADCDSFLATLQDSVDGVVGNLRRFLKNASPIDQKELQVLEVRAKAIPFGQGESPAFPLSHDDDSTATPPGRVPLRRLGKYHLLKEIGRGGMGIVYAGVHTKLNKKVAVKIILPEYSADPRVRARFRREMKAIGELSHQNIVGATDADEADGCHFLVMELVDGLNLDSLVKLCGQLPVADACEIIRQAAVGLQYVYEHHRVHRDLKPSNLMVSTEGVVKILDLGLARLFADDSGSGELTRSNVVMGTADYMAPEQWEDSHKADIRADIYSLGCTFYKVLVGDAPFSDPEYKPAVIKKQAHARLPFPAIQSRRPAVPAGVAMVLERMLAKDPAQRFATPKELAEALRPFTEGCDCRQLMAGAMQRSAELPQGWPANKGFAPETSGNKPETPAVLRTKPFAAPSNWFGGKRWRMITGGAAVAALLGVAVIFGTGWLGKRDEPMQPGRWYYPLRDRKPVPLVWNNERSDSFFDHLMPLEELRVDAKDLGLFSLGEMDRAGYRIQIQIKQSRWVGGVGLFFGYHADVLNGKPCFKCQYLEMAKDHSPAANGGFQLIRGWLTFQQKEQNLIPVDDLRPSVAKVERRMVTEEVSLDMEVRQGKLSKVLWNTELLEFTGPDSWFPIAEADFVGQFGTFSRRGYSVFSKAGFKLYERLSP
jgi:eukaryotic-like serine/threonine-protein kinase